ncbi:MAG TPA: tetratricopeptide repeat protein [Chloroflexia bacterium]|jgi:tetratricopeptide (TPR) repeat protein
MQSISDKRNEQFKIFVAVMLALVTFLGAVVAWRSALAGTEAGNFDDAGIIAALNVEEANTIASIASSQHRSAHVEYIRNLLLAGSLAPPDGSESSLTDVDVREITEALDLANADKEFFPTEYLNEDESYNDARERGEALAEEAERRDLNPDRQFAQANEMRARSVGLVAALVVLGIALFLFAIAEAVTHSVKYAMAGGGLGFMLLGAGAALAMETGTPLSDVYSISSLLFYVIGILTVLAAAGLLVLSLTRRKGSIQEPATSEPEEDPREERFKQLVTVVIGAVALFAAIVAYLQADAGAIGDGAIRKSQGLAAQALGKETTGQATVNYHYGAVYQAWAEMDVLADAAEAQGDAKNATRYGNVRDALAEESEFFAPPYFDPETPAAPDLDAFEADTYVAARAELSERSTAEAAVENAWEEKSNAYILHLTLLAAALALLGLSMTITGRMRPLFIGSGGVLVAITLAWVLATYLKPVETVPEAAAAAFGRGVGLGHKGDDEGAIAAFDEALKAAPGYNNALYERATTYLGMGNYEAAARDYEAAKAGGKRDSNVGWLLGFAYYMLGRFDEASNAYRAVLEQDPRMAGARVDLARTLLAAGKTSEAEAEYKRAMDIVTEDVAAAKAAGKEPSPTLYFYLESAAGELDSLLDQVNGRAQPWTVAPPREKIQNAAAIQPVAERTSAQLKSLLVALDSTGKPPAGELTASISPFTFATVGSDEEVVPGESFPYFTNHVVTNYSYEGMQDGQKVIWKVYLNGEEYPQYRAHLTWDKGAAGEAQQIFEEGFGISNVYVFDPGLYTIEMYVDSHLAQRGTFTIEPGKPEN